MDQFGQKSSGSRRGQHTAKAISAIVALLVLAICVSSAFADVGPLASVITTSEWTTPSTDSESDGTVAVSSPSDPTASDDATGTSSTFHTDTSPASRTPPPPAALPE